MRGSRWVKDVVRYDLDGNYENVITSSFSDYRPVFAQTSGEIAFISNRTGRTQIWLHQKNGELNQLTKFDDSFKIADLAISSDGNLIAFTINAHLHIISRNGEIDFSSNEGSVYKNPIFSIDGKSIYYSKFEKDKWFIETLSFEDSVTKTLTEGYVVKPCYLEDCYYFTKFDEQLLYKSTNGISEFTGINLSVQNPNQIEIVGDSIYYVNVANSKSEILHQNLKAGGITKIIQLSSSRFSIEPEPIRFLTSISRESETNLEAIDLPDR